MRFMKRFNQYSRFITDLSGAPSVSIWAVLFIIFWLLLGPYYNYSDTWQLVMNTTSSIITFIMVFLIQSTQNRDSAAMQIKLDELIRAQEGAHKYLLDLEELTQEQLATIKKRYESLAKQARKELKQAGVESKTMDI